MKTTTRTAYVPPTITARVVPDLDNAAEIGWSADGNVNLRLSPAAAHPGNLPYVLRRIADDLERNRRPDCSGYVVRRLTLVPPLTGHVPTQRGGVRS